MPYESKDRQMTEPWFQTNIGIAYHHPGSLFPVASQRFEGRAEAYGGDAKRDSRRANAG